MRLSITAILFVLALCQTPLAWASSNIAFCRPVVTPEKARLQFVAPDMAYNGIPMMIRQFTMAGDVESVLTFYRQEWAKNAKPNRPPFLEETMRDWKLISSLDNNCLTVVQVKPNTTGVYGLISVSKIGDNSVKRAMVGERVPQLPGSQVLSDIDYFDGVRNARTVVIQNQSHLQANVDFMRKTYESNGWVVFQSNQVGNAQYPAQVLQLKKRYEETHLVFHVGQNGTTQVVAHWIDRP